MSDKQEEKHGGSDAHESHKSHGPHGAAGGHGGGGHEGEHEGAPEWLISFADNVTLMMGFFVVLLAITMQSVATAKTGGGTGDHEGGPAPGMLDTVIAIRDAFHNPVDIDSMDPNDVALIRRIRQRRSDGRAEQDNAVGDEHDVQSTRRGGTHDLGGTLSFDLHSSKLTEQATALGVELAAQFRGTRVVLDIRGHVSAEEERDDPMKGMRLSFDRALAVAGLLAANGIDWRQMRLVANSDSDRVRAVAYDKTGQRENAHVEVVATDDLANDYLQRQEQLPASPQK